ncbi:MAG: regulatory iron-sulfur-containing complex subunit RicT [Candidatus Cloacimonadia bacterium]
MENYIEVEFRSGRTGYYLNDENFELSPDMYVIVEVDRGYDIALVVHSSAWDEDFHFANDVNKAYKIIKIAGEEELRQLEVVEDKEIVAAEKFSSLLPKYPFEMKLIETIYQFDGNKLTFFFTADTRIDFREFVRELAMIFKTRIELHQSTGRDEAKRINGIGVCGYPYCCSSFLKRFNQVTIKMVKEQNLSGNLSKISGPCSRLLCCLNFEEDFYAERAKEFPELGDCVEFNKERFFVYKNDYQGRVVHLTNSDQVMEAVPLDEYKKLPRVKDRPEQNKNRDRSSKGNYRSGRK